MDLPRDDLFQKARDADIEAVAGVRLFRAGRRLRGMCPLCKASEGKKAGGAFSVDPTAGLFKCFACDAGGDVIELEQQIRGGSAREAAERLVQSPPTPIVREALPAAQPRRAGRSTMADKMWAKGQAAQDTPVELYLRGRGLEGPVLERALSRLKFHAEALWAWGSDPDDRVFAPAMLARPRAADGATGGVHATYLALGRRGWTKAALDPAKRMWGPQTSAAGLRGGVWLHAPVDAQTLVVGEGIESAIAAAMLADPEAAVVATLSLGALQGGVLKDRFGRIDPACVQADPESPAFVWPGFKGSRVLIAVDRDMKPVTVKVRKAGGGTGSHQLDSEERARICAGLAEQAWRRALPHLPATSISSLAPAAGRDFADELLVRRAA